MNRIIIIGTSGSGKTTFAKALASTLGIPHVELDAIHWAANWTQVPDDEMRLRVSEATASPRWIMDGNYGQVRDIVWGQADTLIWLKYSFPTIFFRAFKRTIKRVLTQEELWHGNREHWKMAFFSRESVLWWVITTHAVRKRTFTTLLQSEEYHDVAKYVFCTPKEALTWLDSIRKKPLHKKGYFSCKK